MKIIRSFFAVFISVVLLSCITETIPKSKELNVISKILSLDFNKTKQKADDAFEYCQINKMNEDFCILIDMSLHSGVKRFFLWDFKKDTISHLFLVGHGCCDNPWSYEYSKEKVKFSNKDGSHCSSTGKYKIGQRAYSDWGVHVKYVLHGLDSSNSNALSRYIVFHSWEAVSDEEVYPAGTPEGWGCPTISNNSFKKIDPIIQASKKPVLMWIYN